MAYGAFSGFWRGELFVGLVAGRLWSSQSRKHEDVEDNVGNMVDGGVTLAI